ncbi:VOC family protein [Cohnella massiliensis]|uniref:VOC family protein n=1 Tax=Cohnella massiliensis TaxID=1816691 RepID=UPI0009BB7BD5|nr:VOC family protein [Cohnella massiliensis]
MELDRLDHFVLTVKDIEATIRFYADVLGMEPVEFGAGRKALSFGSQKINLHEQGREFEPKASTPCPGSGDFCLVARTPIREVLLMLEAKGVPVEEGPVRRTGALGAIESVYVRDPDGNLVEIANYVSG